MNPDYLLVAENLLSSELRLYQNNDDNELTPIVNIPGTLNDQFFFSSDGNYIVVHGDDFINLFTVPRGILMLRLKNRNKEKLVGVRVRKNTIYYLLTKDHRLSLGHINIASKEADQRIILPEIRHQPVLIDITKDFLLFRLEHDLYYYSLHHQRLVLVGNYRFKHYLRYRGPHLLMYEDKKMKVIVFGSDGSIVSERDYQLNKKIENLYCNQIGLILFESDKESFVLDEDELYADDQHKPEYYYRRNEACKDKHDSLKLGLPASCYASYRVCPDIIYYNLEELRRRGPEYVNFFLDKFYPNYTRNTYETLRLTLEEDHHFSSREEFNEYLLG